MGIIEILIPFLIWAYFMNKAQRELFLLYKKKMNPDYPLVHEDTVKYLDSFSGLLKIYSSPIAMWVIILKKHKDKELNNAAQKVRKLLLVLFGTWIVILLIFMYTWGFFTKI